MFSFGCSWHCWKLWIS